MTKAMTSARWLALTAALLGVALVVSGFLYTRSRLADFDRHARVIEALGNVRQTNELLLEQVLASRFGLLNEYDPITNSELALTSTTGALRNRLAVVVDVDGTLDEALLRLDESVASRRLAVERFKTEYSVMKNSLRYVPVAAHDVEVALSGVSSPNDGNYGEVLLSIHRVAQAVLEYNLNGDESTRDAVLKAISEAKSHLGKLPYAPRARFRLLLAHAAVVVERQTSVDLLVKQVIDSDVGDRLKAVEQVYYERFDETVATSNRYRKILYGWSLLLVVAVCAAGLLLRRLYADLERRVALRTAELREALAALWGEMKLARKIQEALVPGSPAGTDCEIAASMRPTDDVGGDYYDVIQMKDREWILIGDVSGHGVPAGLIMMMCQTAVRTVLRADPAIMPDRLLAIVNAVLTQNIRQLGEDKYMTISAFRRDSGGTVLFAGAHQDIHIYRSQTDSVETIATEGAWLGIKDEIGHTLKTKRLQLFEDDVFLLYTDGITEAKRDGVLFDTGGVTEILSRSRGKTAEQVLHDMFAGLEGFSLVDDATVLVLKQLAGPRQGTHVQEEAGVRA